MKKAERLQVFNKYGGKCAYCGCELGKTFHVDHIQAHWHTVPADKAEGYGITKGSNDLDNLNPACPRCNRWKSTWTIEQFRAEIQEQLTRLRAYSSNYRMALDYGMIEEKQRPVKFHFEYVLEGHPFA